MPNTDPLVDEPFKVTITDADGGFVVGANITCKYLGLPEALHKFADQLKPEIYKEVGLTPLFDKEGKVVGVTAPLEDDDEWEDDEDA